MIEVTTHFINKKLKKTVESYIEKDEQFKPTKNLKFNSFTPYSIFITDDIKALKKIDTIPILFVSEKFNKHEKIEIFKHGADRYLPKPFKKEEFLLVLKSIIKPYLLLKKKELEVKQINKKHQDSIKTIKYKNKINSSILNSTANMLFLLNSTNKIEKSNQTFKEFFPKKKTLYKILHNKKLFLRYLPKINSNSLLNFYDLSEWENLILKYNINKIMIKKGSKEYYFKIDIKEITDKHKVVSMTDITLMEKNLMQIKLATMGKLTSGITHEINTPITYIKNNIELIEDSFDYMDNVEKLKEENKESIEAIYDGISRIENIVDSVKSITSKAKKEKQKINLYRSIIYGMRIIYNRAKNITPIYINKKRFNLLIDTDEEIFETSVLKEKIEQIWLIILNNACDEFAKTKLPFDQREISIDISKQNNKTKIVFKDNANNGIKKEILDKIFDPFVSTKTQDGMGIGLNIAKNIIDEHGGSIKAFNDKNYAVFEVVI